MKIPYFMTIYHPINGSLLTFAYESIETEEMIQHFIEDIVDFMRECSQYSERAPFQSFEDFYESYFDEPTDSPPFRIYYYPLEGEQSGEWQEFDYLNEAMQDAIFMAYVASIALQSP